MRGLLRAIALQGSTAPRLVRAEEAFAQKLAVVGTVTAVVKGRSLSRCRVRAFMPASRSGTRDAADSREAGWHANQLPHHQARCNDEDVVVDRRVVLEEQARSESQGRLAAMKEGDTVTGTVRSRMSYGAFVDLGGVDGLLHVSDIAWGRVNKPEDVLSVGQELQLRILKIDPETKKISLGLKQLEAEPWEVVPTKISGGPTDHWSGHADRRFRRLVEIEPGIEGLIHISEMSWGKKIRHPSDVLKQGILSTRDSCHQSPKKGASRWVKNRR